MSLEITNLTKEFGKGSAKKIAVDDVSLTISEGQVLSILGRNGAGKTTLIKMMIGLLRQDMGKVLWHGQNIQKNLREYKSSVGCVLEGSRNVYWYMSGIENLMYFGRLSGISPKICKTRALDLLAEFDLADVANKKAGEYSRGMLQKLSICLALLNKPRLLFLDEPTLGLDAIVKDKMRKKLRELVQRENCALVITSHELDICQDLSDRIVILDNGKVQIDGPMETMWDNLGLERKALKLSFNCDLSPDILAILQAFDCQLERREKWGNGIKVELSIANAKFDKVAQDIVNWSMSLAILSGFERSDLSLEYIFRTSFEKR